MKPTPKFAPLRPAVPEPANPPSSARPQEEHVEPKAVVPKAHLPQPLSKRRKLNDDTQTVGTLVKDKGVDPGLFQQPVDIKKEEDDEEWKGGWDDATEAMWRKDELTPGLWWFKRKGESWRRWKDYTVPWHLL